MQKSNMLRSTLKNIITKGYQMTKQNVQKEVHIRWWNKWNIATKQTWKLCLEDILFVNILIHTGI